MGWVVLGLNVSWRDCLHPSRMALVPVQLPTKWVPGTVPCQYIPSLILFIIDNPNNFQTDSEVHGLHAKSKNQLFILNTKLTSVEKCYITALLGEDDKKDAVLYFQWIHVVVGIIWSMVPYHYVRKGVQDKNSCDRIILKRVRLHGRV